MREIRANLDARFLAKTSLVISMAARSLLVSAGKLDFESAELARTLACIENRSARRYPSPKMAEDPIAKIMAIGALLSALRVSSDLHTSCNLSISLKSSRLALSVQYFDCPSEDFHMQRQLCQTSYDGITSKLLDDIQSISSGCRLNLQLIHA